MIAYCGAPLSAGALMFDATHSLEHQAYAPREMVRGTINVDGTGLVWYEAEQPRRYATERSPWADPNLRSMAASIRASVLLMAVRSATPGLGFSQAEVSPYVVDRIAFTLNGWLEGFRGAVGQRLLSELSPERFGALGTLNDAEAIFMTLMDRVDRLGSGQDVASAMRTLVRDLRSLCAQFDVEASLNMIACDGAQTVAIRSAVATQSNSLYVHQGAQGDIIIASEPINDADGWKPIGEEQMVTVDISSRSVQTYAI
jgi:glutamine amidotransferase